MKIKGILYTVASALLFGFTPILASFTYALGNNALTLTFLRNLMVLPILFLLTKKDRVALPVDRAVGLKIVGVGIFGTAATTVLLYASYQSIGVGTATTLHFLYPIFVALICRWVYHETLGRTKILALAIAFIGVALFLDPRDFNKLSGIAMASVSGLTYASYMVAVEKFRLSDLSPFKLSFYLSSTVCTLIAAINLVIPVLQFNQPPLSYFLIFLVALGTSFLAVVLLQLGIRELGSTTASILCLFEPVTGIIAGLLFLNEPLSLAKIIGCTFILAAVLVLMKGKPKPVAPDEFT